MTTTFEDNIEVTLEDINNIAVDLGYTDFSAFDTEKFGVDKLNQITADIVSSGVLRTGENGALGCNVIAADGKAYVQPGVIVFESGAKVRITESFGIDIISGTVIYAFNDSTTGKASIAASEVLPAGDCVLLAEVNGESIVEDRRSGCVARVVLTADTPNVYREVSVTLENIKKIDGSLANNEITVDIGTNAYSYIMLVEVKRVSGTSTNTYTPMYNNAFLSEDGAENRISAQSGSKSQSVIFERSKQYQTITLPMTAGVEPSGTYTVNFIVM